MHRQALCTALLFALVTGASAADFTYRGQLHEEGAAASGRYDLKFSLYADRDSQRLLHGPVDVIDVVVKDGQFAVPLDLPDFAASGWLEVAVRPADEVAFWPLGGREPVTLKGGACPAAWELGGNAGTLAGTDFLGTTDSQALELRTANTRSLRITPSLIDVGGTPATTNFAAGSGANSVLGGASGGTVGGGGAFPNSIAGLANVGPNRVFDQFGTVSGGLQNHAGSNDATFDNDRFATVGGGHANSAGGLAGTIAGGIENATSAGTAITIGGGFRNQASGTAAAILGGTDNVANGAYSFIGGGAGALASGEYALVTGGALNTASSQFASVLGGFRNCAGGNYSAAGGRRAKVLPAVNPADGSSCAGVVGYTGQPHHGTFVWSDNQDIDFASSGADQFLVRARGGVGINLAPLDASVELMVAADADGDDVANVWLKERDSNNGILMSAGNASTTINNNAEFFIDHYNGTAANRRLELRNTGVVIIRSNITGTNSGVTMAANAGSWSSLSDRRLKTAFSTIDPIAVLDRLVAIPISEWSYIAQGEAVRHIGPMAQDFAAAFAVGENDTTISTIDADGVALAAIQGLNAKLERENAALREELADLGAVRGQLEALGNELAALRRSLADMRSEGSGSAPTKQP